MLYLCWVENLTDKKKQKIMKKLFLLLTLSLFILSCDKAKEEKTQEKKDSEKEYVYSENIQDTFFGVKFGASREEVIKAFKKEGLYLNNHNSNKKNLSFQPYGRDFSFGGSYWEYVDVNLSNGKFYGIIFGYTPEYKETALSQFESVLSALYSKYKMNEEAFEDTNIYKWYTAKSKDGKAMAVQCSKKESSGGQMRYYVNLVYGDSTLDKPNDEL